MTKGGLSFTHTHYYKRESCMYRGSLVYKLRFILHQLTLQSYKSPTKSGYRSGTAILGGRVKTRNKKKTQNILLVFHTVHVPSALNPQRGHAHDCRSHGPPIQLDYSTMVRPTT